MEKRKPTYIEAILPFLFLIFLVVVGYIILGLRIEAMLITAAVFAGLLARRMGYSWNDIEEAISSRLKKVTPAILIMWSVGIIIGTFMFAGSIPILIYYGLEWVNPQYLFVFSFLICLLLSTVTGTAWGAAGTAGVAMIGIAQGLDVSLAITAGAVISGSIFGDKMSPLSDTTNLAPACTGGVDLYEHIKHQLYTTTPSAIICIILYLIIGMRTIEGSAQMSPSAIAMMESLDSMYQWHWLMLVPMIIIFTGAFLKKPTVPSMLFGALVAIIVGVFVNDFTLQNGVSAAILGFKDVMTGIDVTLIDPAVTKLVNRGGMNGMIGIITIIYCGYSYTSIMSATGSLDIMFKPLINKIHSKGQAMLGAVVSTFVLSGVGGTSYVPTLIVPELFRKVFVQQGMKLRNLSRTIEDAGTCANPVWPWSMSGIFYATAFAVPTLTYAPWAFFCFLPAIFAILFGFTGFGIATLTKEEKEQELLRIENAE